MKSFFRFLAKNKLYTCIEVFGMSVAISFVVFIGAFVIREYNLDSDIKKQNVFVGHSERMFIGSATVKEQLEGKFPEVEDMCRVLNTHIFGGINMNLSSGDYSGRQKATIVDENFFRFFPFPLESGSPETVLKEKNSVVVSRSFARRLFGKEDPVGKPVRINVNGHEAELSISGVFSDFRNTIFYAPEIIYRIDLLGDIDGSMTGNGNGSTVLFMRLADGTDAGALGKRMLEILGKEDRLYIYGLFKDFIITPFGNVNSCSLETTVPFEGVVEMDFINLFIAAGIFLLLFAVLNYVSLTVAQTGFRAREMASRRLVGASRAGIISRYIAESFVLTLVSFVLALMIVSLTAPYLGELIGKEVEPFRNMGWMEVAFMTALLLVLSLLSGIIPALLVSRYKPIDVVRGNFSRTSKMTLGRVLVGFQSGVAFITLTLVVVMSIQLRYMTDKPMGYEKDNRLYIQGASSPDVYHLEELKSLACVEKTGWLQFEPMTLGSAGTAFRINGAEQKFDMYYGDSAAFDILGFKVLRKTGEPLKYSAWLPESTMRALGLDYDCTQITFDDGSIIPVCGIIGDYQKGKAGMKARADIVSLAWIKEMERPEDFMMLRSVVVKVAGDENDALDTIRNFYKEKGYSEEEVNVQTFNMLNARLYSLEDRNLRLMAIFTMLTLLLTALAMFAMSTYYARQHAKDSAVKKIMGSGRGLLFWETASGFLKSVGISVVVALPLAWMAVGKWLEGYSYRIGNPVYVYFMVAMLIAVVAILSISWQLVKLINASPVKYLKNE